MPIKLHALFASADDIRPAAAWSALAVEGATAMSASRLVSAPEGTVTTF